MDRRTFLATVAGGLLAAPLGIEAQEARLPRIGILTTASPGSSPPANSEAFVQGLRESGYVEGRNILLEQRYAQETPKLFPALAADLVRLKVDLIFARGPWAVTAANSATRAIPIIGIDLESDPVADGLVKSLARPGGNLTGMFLDLAELSGKQLQIQSLEVHGPDDFESVLPAAISGGVGALFVVDDPLIYVRATRITEFATRSRLPTTSYHKGFVQAGGLMAYGADLADNYRRAAIFVDKILKGAKPGDLPVEQPTKFLLVINMRTAKVLGLTIPQSVLLRADEVIQ